MRPGSCKNCYFSIVTLLFMYKSHTFNLCEQDLALDNLRELICHKIHPANHWKYIVVYRLLERDTWNDTTVCKLFVSDKNTCLYVTIETNDYE